MLLSTAHASAQTMNAYINAGDKAMQQGDYYSASIFYYQAIEFESEDPEIYFKMAEACRQYNDYDNAIRYYNLTIADDKENKFPVAVFRLGQMKKFTGEYEESKAYFNKYYYQHAADSTSYFTLRAKRESAYCDSAVAILRDTVPAKVENLGSTINSVYSDFAGEQVGDETLYYSSLRFTTADSEKKKTKKFTSKILKSKNKNARWQQPDILDSVINNENYFVCNSTFSPDHKLMIFTRCIRAGANLVCDLYESNENQGKWSDPKRLNDSINAKGYTTTQPDIAVNGTGSYTLYFASDRPGGFGKLDIWKCYRSADGKYTAPENLGAVINTAEDDLTPFFDDSIHTLYFSSDGHPGLGGFDVFASALKNGIFSRPKNIGYPVNTSYNEIYYSVNKDGRSGFLSSNRPGSMYIKARTCCYDIYNYRMIEKPPVPPLAAKDSLTTASEIRAKKDSLGKIAAGTYVTFLPLKLYFHNDEPEPKTTRTNTAKNYEQLYAGYLQLIPEYKSAYAFNLSGTAKENAESTIENFFTKTVIASHSDLERFCNVLLGQMKEGKKVEITVRGSASPLAKNDYNINLSKRRISSLINYLKVYHNGEVMKFMEEHSLLIKEDPVGENLASRNVSDDIKDKRNSVYSPEAGMLRFIEIINVSVDGQPAK